jgi:hypothetical protein
VCQRVRLLHTPKGFTSYARCKTDSGRSCGVALALNVKTLKVIQDAVIADEKIIRFDNQRPEVNMVTYLAHAERTKSTRT